MPRAKATKPELHKAPAPFTHRARRGRKADRQAKPVAALSTRDVPPIEQWPAWSPHAIWRQIAELKPNPGNANKHPEKQLVALEASWREFGQARPILVNADNVIVAGHGTVEAARRLGIEAVVVDVAESWSDDTARAFMFADNQLASLSEVDKPKLRVQLADLSTIKTVNLGAIGFSNRELAALLKPRVAKPRATPAAIEPTNALVVPLGALSDALLIAIRDFAAPARSTLWAEELTLAAEACDLELRRRGREGAANIAA